jgi:hypothetical protein
MHQDWAILPPNTHRGTELRTSLLHVTSRVPRAVPANIAALIETATMTGALWNHLPKA